MHLRRMLCWEIGYKKVNTGDMLMSTYRLVSSSMYVMYAYWMGEWKSNFNCWFTICKEHLLPFHGSIWYQPSTPFQNF